MIRKSTIEDIPQLKALWIEVFGDPTEFIDKFFEELYNPDRCLVYETDNRLVATLYLLDASIVVESRHHKIYYLYSVATHPAYSGKGIMSKMLDAAYAKTEADGRTALIAIPQDAYAYSFYKKRHFLDCSFYHQYRMNRSDLPSGDTIALKRLLTPEILSQLRAQISEQCAVLWSHSQIAFQMWDIKRMGGAAHYVTHEKGGCYALMKKSGNELELFEFHTPTTDALTCIATLTEGIQADQVVVNTPITIEGASGKDMRSGMIRVCSEFPSCLHPSDIYINLGLSV